MNIKKSELKQMIKEAVNQLSMDERRANSKFVSEANRKLREYVKELENVQNIEDVIGDLLNNVEHLNNENVKKIASKVAKQTNDCVDLIDHLCKIITQNGE